MAERIAEANVIQTDLSFFQTSDLLLVSRIEVGVLVRIDGLIPYFIVKRCVQNEALLLDADPVYDNLMPGSRIGIEAAPIQNSSRGRIFCRILGITTGS